MRPSDHRDRRPDAHRAEAMMGLQMECPPTQAPAGGPDTALAMRGICKRFPGVVALDDVSISLGKGEVLALVGENGAGKSTLMKILSGAFPADSGTIELFGKPVISATPHQMLELGVAVIYQELLLANHLTVAENIYLGRLPRTKFGFVDWAGARSAATNIIERLGFDIDPLARVSSLSVAQRQIVEIAKALSRNARIIVLDEPSAVLGEVELQKLLEIIRTLSSDSVGFIYISHRLEEIFTISQRTVVMRDGKVVGASLTADLDRDQLVRMMVGRALKNIYPERTSKAGEPLLEAEGLSNETLRDVSISVRRGEIVGVCGLAGAGRTELMRALCGADPASARRFKSLHLDALPRSPRLALASGVGLLPEDRHHQGLFGSQSVAFNISLSKLRNIRKGPFLSHALERGLVNELIRKLRVKTPRLSEIISHLSGGNQQKCVLARLLNAGCEVLLIDEPTRGVDVGAKREIYRALSDLADVSAIGIIMVSSELPEIIGLCDRVYVMHDGRVTGEFSRTNLTEEKLMQAATA
jgi:ribose transport system ATP-binding protein